MALWNTIQIPFFQYVTFSLLRLPAQKRKTVFYIANFIGEWLQIISNCRNEIFQIN